MPTITKEFYLAAMPVMILSFGGLLVLMQSVFKSIGGTTKVFASTMFILVATVAAVLFSKNSDGGAVQSFLSGTLVTGSAVCFASCMILGIAIIVALLMHESYLKVKFFRGEICALFLMMLAGMLVMISADDLITLFVGLELASIGLYPLVGYVSADRFSIEGAVKYFILGSVAAAILLFGFAFLYASTGTMQISGIVSAFRKINEHSWLKLGALFTAVGFGFKLSLVPFHLWAPDAYESAPTGITAFMATSVKIMIIIASLRFFSEGFGSMYTVWLPAFTFMAMLSMIVGNVMALVQTSLKRMLAYSSIAHSGYMAVAICALSGTSSQLSVPAVLFYLLTYSFISIGTFAVLMWFESEDVHNLNLDDLNGLAKKYPKACFALVVFMFSLGGMPPTAGFIAKFFVFNAALTNQLYTLIIIGVIGSTISLYYYLRVIVRMYMSEPVSTMQLAVPKRSYIVSVVVCLSVIASLLVGTAFPSNVLRQVKKAASELVQG